MLTPKAGGLLVMSLAWSVVPELLLYPWLGRGPWRERLERGAWPPQEGIKPVGPLTWLQPSWTEKQFRILLGSRAQGLGK